MRFSLKMLEKFQQHIIQQQLIRDSDTPLLAVSGGVDSVVLCDLFARTGRRFGVAHCNFLLRGKMSDEDEKFVKDLATKYDAKCHTTRFDTTQIAQARNVSIQVAARDLRYAWFAEIMERENYTCLATAHHANDAVETVLYHLTRGTGIRGLHGIPVRRGRIIRPLLFAKKDEILAYATQRSLPYREDASNAQTKYARNKIRLQVVPVLKEINPSLEATFLENIERFKDAEALYNFAITHIKSVVFTVKNNEYHIDSKALLSYPTPATVLYELLRDFGFHQAQTQQIFNALDRQPGARYKSATHEVLRDRDVLIIRKIHDSKMNFLLIKNDNEQVVFNNNLFNLKFIKKEKFTLNTSPNVACLDADKLIFPLKLRHWQQGDTFQPLGMNGKHKLVSDFFTNKKLSQFEKENVPILTSGEDICWIAGHRIDERFKVTSATIQILTIQQKNNNTGPQPMHK